MKLCTICHKPIRLTPSAAQRAAKDISGKTAKDYENIFTEHADCILAKRHTIPTNKKD
jgi:hypothetical protein